MFIFWWSCGLGDSKEHQIEGQGTEVVFLAQVRLDNSARAQFLLCMTAIFSFG